MREFLATVGQGKTVMRGVRFLDAWRYREERG